MKLRLPSLLATALLACLAASSSVYADTFLAEGVNADDLENSTRFYDGDKGANWDNSLVIAEAIKVYSAANNDMEKAFGDLAPLITTPEYGDLSSTHFSNLTNDSGHCWAYTAANMLQYWQTYYGVFAKKAREEGPTIKHGLNYDKEYMSDMRGTQSLKLNALFYNSFNNVGADPSKAFKWYLTGINGENQNDSSSAPGYFSQYFSGDPSTYTNFFPNGNWSRTMSEIADLMRGSLGYTQNSDGVWEQTTKGQIMHLDLAGNSTHAITCYGLETDENGDLKALYVVNSDDGTYNLEKVYCKLVDTGYNQGVHLYYDEACTEAWRSNFRVTGWSSINTPEVLKNMLAEYESGKLTWMGTLEAWTNSPAVAADVNVLPTDATGWMTYAGTGTEHAGYYNTCYTTGRGVEFNDEAASGTVNVAEDITVAAMAVNNSALDYTFKGEGQTITADSLRKTGSGALVFDGVKLYTNGTVTANGNSITFTDDANIDSIDESSLVISGGTTTIRNSSTWTNLKNLALSEQTRLNTGASVHVAGNITTTEATGTLAEGTNSGINAAYCITVGTEGDASTGNVELKGDMTAGSYIHILGNANITGNVSSNGTAWGTADSHIDIKGNATIGGSLSAKQYVTIGGNATLGADASIDGKLTVGGTLSGTNTEENISVTAASMELGGNVSHVDLKASTITLAAKDDDTLTLDSVNMELTGTELSLTNVTVTGNSSFSSTAGALTLHAENVTIVLDASNSSLSVHVSPVMPLSLEPLTQAEEGGASLTLESDMLAGVDLSGSLTLDLSAWKELMQTGDTLTLAFAENMNFAEGATVQATFDNGATFVSADNIGSNMAVFTRPVPEPTTTALSLLALAGLAARRRRK